MFTDVVGYTALMQRDEEAARIVRRRHRQVLEAAVSAHGGDLLQYLGDGSLTTFPSVVEAVHAAIEVQRGLRQEPVVPLRIGIHQGDISYDTPRRARRQCKYRLSRYVPISQLENKEFCYVYHQTSYVLPNGFRKAAGRDYRLGTVFCLLLPSLLGD